MQWLEGGDDTEGDFLQTPDTGSLSGIDPLTLSDCEIDVETFCQRLIKSNVMEADTIAGLREKTETNVASSFAEYLIADGKLTQFQARVLLEGLEVPLLLDRYLILDEIGRGGMGVVYKAIHRQMDRLVALKILPKAAVDSPQKARRFQREVKTAAKLDHPNIVTAFDATESEGTHFLVMSLIDGQNLAELVRSQGPVTDAAAIDYVTQTARGLAHAHSLGITHRDIKPGNLLLDREGKIKILDMGLARIHDRRQPTRQDQSTELTEDGAVLGTLAYLAPEQALDTRNADARSDIYALGCTLYFLLTGRAIYREDTVVKTILAHREGTIPSLHDAREDVPPELDAFFRKMVAKEPEERFQNMEQVLAKLETLSALTTPPLPAEAANDTSDDARESNQVSFATQAKRTGTAELGKVRWRMAATIALGVVLLLAGLVIQWKTAAGLVVLEMDRADMIGAVVSIDGEEKITIKTAKDLEPIRITPDKERHTLMISIAGYKTFSRDFSFETGNTQWIRVRLEPLKSTPGQVTAVSQSKDKTPNTALTPYDAPAPAITPFSPEEAKRHQEAWAKHLAVPVDIENSIGMKLRVIPAGEFLMGSSDGEIQRAIQTVEAVGWAGDTRERLSYERGPHRVELTDPFAIGVYEVTRGQFRRFVDAKNYITDAEKDGKGGQVYLNGKWVYDSHASWKSDFAYFQKQTDTHPVVNVSWNDAVAFCEWLSQAEGVTYRLPTEAEWEFACRAGSQQRYSFGDEESALGEYASVADQRVEHGTRPVGQKKPNAFGLFDVHGNVFEWCLDQHGRYPTDPSVNPIGNHNTDFRVMRSGAYHNHPLFVRTSYRHLGLPDRRAPGTGFRVVRLFEQPSPDGP